MLQISTSYGNFDYFQNLTLGFMILYIAQLAYFIILENKVTQLFMGFTLNIVIIFIMFLQGSDFTSLILAFIFMVMIFLKLVYVSRKA